MAIQLQSRQTIQILPALSRQMSVPLGKAHAYQSQLSRGGTMFVNGEAVISPLVGLDQTRAALANSVRFTL